VKITNIRATPVNIPLEAPFWWTGGLYPGTSKAIVEVETDEGLVGLGEAPSTDVCAMIVVMREALAGRDPLDIAACERICVPPWQIVQNTDDARVVKAFGAIEIAEIAQQRADRLRTRRTQDRIYPVDVAHDTSRCG